MLNKFFCAFFTTESFFVTFLTILSTFGKFARSNVVISDLIAEASTDNVCATISIYSARIILFLISAKTGINVPTNCAFSCGVENLSLFLRILFN